MPIYNLLQKELQILREYLDSTLNKGQIRPSKSPTKAPILFILKVDGMIRLYVDYRRLNKIIIKNRYLLPLVGKLFNRLDYIKIFIKLNLLDIYYRLYIKKGDEQKTAFKIRYGYFKYLMLPFSLSNAPTTFQSYINKALENLVDTIYVVYLDNILIYLKDKSKYVKYVKQVLERLYTQGLYAKLSKYSFYTKLIKFLSYFITPEGIIIDPI